MQKTTLTYLLAILLVGLLGKPLIGQEECGTETTESAIQAFIVTEAQPVINVTEDPIIPIKAWLIGKSNGSGHLSTSVLNQAIRDANNHFAPTRLKFTLCETERINSDFYYSYQKSKEASLVQSYSKPNVINVYITQMSGLCGYAYFPSANKDVIFKYNEYPHYFV
ncbi:MAG: hypothetical protein AAF960_01925 [Bacteroidota bacterium]